MVVSVVVLWSFSYFYCVPFVKLFASDFFAASVFAFPSESYRSPIVGLRWSCQFQHTDFYLLSFFVCPYTALGLHGTFKRLCPVARLAPNYCVFHLCSMPLRDSRPTCFLAPVFSCTVHVMMGASVVNVRVNLPLAPAVFVALLSLFYGLCCFFSSCAGFLLFRYCLSWLAIYLFLSRVGVLFTPWIFRRASFWVRWVRLFLRHRPFVACWVYLVAPFCLASFRRDFLVPCGVLCAFIFIVVVALIGVFVFEYVLFIKRFRRGSLRLMISLFIIRLADPSGASFVFFQVQAHV